MEWKMTKNNKFYIMFSFKLIDFVIFFLNIKSHLKQLCTVFWLIVYCHISTSVSITLIGKFIVSEQWMGYFSC